MAQFTILMFLLFLLAAVIVSVVWIIMRKYKTKKFNEMHFNREIVDEPFLKYYKKIPDKIYDLGQMANDKEDRGNSKTMELRTDVRAIPTKSLRKNHIIPSSETNNIVLKPKNFQLSQGPRKMGATGTIQSDVGDVVIQEQSFSEIDMGDLEYKINESRVPGSKATDSWGKRRLKIKEREADLEDYQEREPQPAYEDILEVPLEIQKTINLGNVRPAGMMNDGLNSQLENSEIQDNFGFNHSHGGKAFAPKHFQTKPLDSGQMDITPNINYFRSQNNSQVQRQAYREDSFGKEQPKEDLKIGRGQKGYIYSNYESSKNHLKDYSPTSTVDYFLFFA